jgi:hypothetical protein
MGQLIESVGLVGELVVIRSHNKLGKVVSVDKNKNQLIIETLIEGDTFRVSADDCYIVDHNAVYRVYEAVLRNGFIDYENLDKEVNLQ